jgi:kynurenine 3-monooxygenase
MALDNYIEMRDRVDDPDYRLQRQLELLLANRHPERFVPRYSQVMFQRVPYAEAQAAGRRQRALLEDLTRGRERLEQIDLAAADAAVARL